MIEINQNDVIYKLNKDVRKLDNIQIPSNATVFDASGCECFNDISGLKNYPHLRVLLLSHTDIRSADLKEIPDFIEAVDIRHCPNLRSYSLLPKRTENPLYVLISFAGERMLHSIPDNLNIEIDGWIKNVCKKNSPKVFKSQNTRS